MDEIRAHFRMQAEACDRLGSPFTAKVCRILARQLDETTRTGKTVLRWPGDVHADAVSLRLCGALHELVLADADAGLAACYPPNEVDEDAIAATLAKAIPCFDDRLAAGLANPPQTNEIARSALLLPGLLMIARESGLLLDLREIGSSAGLNLLFDRFHYRYGDTGWGDPDSLVRLTPEIRGKAPPLGGALSVRSRSGCDIAPLDIADPAARLRLRSYVWADQAARLARLDAALAIAAESAPRLVQMDAAGFVAEALAERTAGGSFVLCHSIMWQYLPETTKAAIAGLMKDVGATATTIAPVHWLRVEPLSAGDAFATLSLTQWPGGETRHLARCDYHGRWIEWLGQP
jgi:hypothetical protein